MIHKNFKCDQYTIPDLLHLSTTSVVFCIRHVIRDKYEECLLFNDIRGVTLPVLSWRLAFGQTTELALGSIQRNSLFACAVPSLSCDEAMVWGSGCLSNAIKMLAASRTAEYDNYEKYKAARDNILDNHVLQLVKRF